MENSRKVVRVCIQNRRWFITDCVCVRAHVCACTCNVYVQYSKVIPASRVDGTEVPSEMIIATLVSIYFVWCCIVMLKDHIL